MSSDGGGQTERQLGEFRADFDALRREIGRVIVGQAEVVDGVLGAMVAGGHVLLEGMPGLGKTRLVRALAGAVDFSFQRIQCTPDLMPADVIGTYVVMETPQGRRTFEFQKGPLFANLVLADQVNRTTPKTQSALLEAMDEAAITVSTETFHLPRPYLLVATQNPLETEGVYPLPQAQLDRFLFHLVMGRPSCEEMEEILRRTTDMEKVEPRPVVDAKRIEEMGALVRAMPVADEVRRWGIALVDATHPDSETAPEPVRRYVQFGAGPRGAIALLLGAKIKAILDGRFHVAGEDILGVAVSALRHRLVLGFRGHADNVSAAEIVEAIIESAPNPPSSAASR